MSIENLPGEEWRPVVGYEEFYEVSNMGRLRTLPRKCWNGKVFWAQKPMILRQYVSKSSGYAWVTLNPGKRPKNHFVHRVVLSAFTPNPCPEALRVINHMDGNKRNNHLINLEWTTYRDNARHAVATGLFAHNILRNRLTGRPVEILHRDGRVEWYRSSGFAEDAGYKRRAGIHPAGYTPRRWIKPYYTIRYAELTAEGE